MVNRKSMFPRKYRKPPLELESLLINILYKLIFCNLLCRIVRHRGRFGNVSVAWQLFQNGSALQPGQEFYETSGTVNFMDGEGAKPIILHAFPDTIPEFNEFYILKLVNISGAVFSHLFYFTTKI